MASASSSKRASRLHFLAMSIALARASSMSARMSSASRSASAPARCRALPRLVRPLGSCHPRERTRSLLELGPQPGPLVRRPVWGFASASAGVRNSGVSEALVTPFYGANAGSLRSGGMAGASGVNRAPVAAFLTGPVAKYPKSSWVTTQVGSIQTSFDPG